MKYYILILFTAVALTACKNEATKGDTAVAQTETSDVQEDYTSYGTRISPENALSNAEIATTYANLKSGDTATVKFQAPINSVCAKKGCWMRLAVGEEEIFVKFKDYGFFVPLDASGQAIASGKAYIEEVGVDELKHMAEDAGKTAEEIAAITTPQREMRFMADGVLIKSE